MPTPTPRSSAAPSPITVMMVSTCMVTVAATMMTATLGPPFATTQYPATVTLASTSTAREAVGTRPMGTLRERSSAIPFSAMVATASTSTAGEVAITRPMGAPGQTSSAIPFLVTVVMAYAATDMAGVMDAFPLLALKGPPVQISSAT